MNRSGLSLLLAALLLLSSCSEPEGFRKETFPVTGEVSVDGKPAANVQVALHDVAGVDTEHPTFSMTYTDKDGKFSLSTYEQGDGVPAGEYAMTFNWGELNMFSMQYGGPDKLKGKYSDPKASTHRVTVAPGKPVDLGRIELATSEK